MPKKNIKYFYYGTPGITGVKGPDSPSTYVEATSIGPQGVRGPTGSQGPVGPQGPRGPTGPTSYPQNDYLFLRYTNQYLFESQDTKATALCIGGTVEKSPSFVGSGYSYVANSGGTYVMCVDIITNNITTSGNHIIALGITTGGTYPTTFNVGGSLGLQSSTLTMFRQVYISSGQTIDVRPYYPSGTGSNGTPYSLGMYNFSLHRVSLNR